MTAQQEAEAALTQWAAQQREAGSTRDRLVRAALAAGITKHRIHVITGIARTTIDRIIKQGES